MNVRNFSMVLALVAFSASSIFAQTPGTFFWSTSDLNSGATNGAFSGDFAVGDTGSLFLYYDTNGDAANDIGVGGFNLSLAFDTAGIVQFAGVGGEVFDFQVTLPAAGGFVLGRRFSVDGMGTGAGQVAGPNALLGGTIVDGGNGLEGFRATNLFGQGLRSANDGSAAALDGGYDTGATAFEIGRIDFQIVGEGTANLNILDGSEVVSGPIDIGFVHAGAAFNVGVVPEPTSAGLLALGLIGLVARRRR